jgi:hypothetical protein
MAYWLTQYDLFGFPAELSARGECDLSVMFIGGNWEWLVRHDGRDVAEGSARCAAAAKQQAEDAAQRFLDMVYRTQRAA